MPTEPNLDEVPDLTGISFESFFRRHDAVMLVTNGETGSVIDANDAALRFYGYSLRQMRSMKIGELSTLPPEKLNAERLQAVTEERKYFIGSHWLANGETRAVEVHTTLTVLAGQKCLVSTIHNITERQRTEESLRKSEERFRHLFEQSSFGMAISDQRFCFIKANPAFCAMLGYTERELAKLTFKDITHPDHLSGDADGIQRLVKGEIPFYHAEKRYVTKSGTVIDGAVTISPLRGIDGAYSGGLVLLQNITDRKYAEQALRDSEERFRNLYETSTDAILIVDRDTKQILDVNPAACKLYGYSRDEFLLMKNTDVSAEPEKTATAVDREVAVVPLRYHRKKDGTVFPVEIAGGYFTLYGRTVHTAFVRDISERKKAEEERLKIESHLRQVQKLESLGVLAGGIAHDFNNLMSGIFGYIDLAQSETAGGRRGEYLSKALASIDRARGLTQQLLTFAKGGAPARKTEPLGPLLQETAQFALSGSNVSCSCSVPADLWLVAFDRSQMTQVIDNIVINAQQAMPMGGTIEVTAQNMSLAGKEFATLPEGRYVKVSIRDHGIGIPRELLPRIFDPFFTTKTKGHGLGLSTCYSIVKQHDGLIDVDSEPGKGSTFHIYLPASLERAAVTPERPSRPFKGSGCILIMDDERTTREAVVEMLQTLGFSVVQASNGSDALDQYRAGVASGKSFAAVIADLTVPGGMGGVEMVEALRKFDAGTPVFVTSGYADDPAMAHPATYGFTASIRKPYTMSELAALLERYLK